MGDIDREYLIALDAAGLDLFVDFQFTGAAGEAPWGDFAKLHRMDQPLATAHRYRAVVAAADGTLWNPPPPPPAAPVIAITGGSVAEGNAGIRWLSFTITLSHAWNRVVSVGWATLDGTAVAGRDYRRAAGRIAFAAGQTVRTIRVAVIGDRLREADERVRVGLGAPVEGSLVAASRLARGTILDDDRPTAAAFAAAALETDRLRR